MRLTRENISAVVFWLACGAVVALYTRAQMFEFLVMNCEAKGVGYHCPGPDFGGVDPIPGRPQARMPASSAE